jgi:signal transduction histidine kinase
MQKSIKNILRQLHAYYVIVGGKSIVFLFLALVIAMMTIFFSDNWILRINSQDAKIAEIREIILYLNQFKSNVYQAEGAQRGYVITQKLYYLQFYNKAIQDARFNLFALDKAIPKAIGTVKALDKKELDELKVTLEAKVTEMNITIELVKSGNTRQALNVVSLDKGLFQANKITLITDYWVNYYETILKNTINERIKSNEGARSAVIFGPLLLMLLVVLVLRQLFRELADKNKTQILLSEINTINQNKLVEQANILSELALSNMADVERERRHLAREVHDELGSILTATKMDISWVLKALKDSQPLIVEKLKKTNSYLDKAIYFKRELIQNLHPPMISSFGFWPALKNMIEDTAQRNEWELDLILPSDEIEINETIALVAYRVIQETLNNCSKYAKAKKISVFIICDSSNLKIEIQDDGIGLDIAKLQNATTHGIKGMSHRVQAIGGKYTISSTVGAGVNTLIILPIQKNQSID